MNETKSLYHIAFPIADVEELKNTIKTNMRSKAFASFITERYIPPTSAEELLNKKNEETVRIPLRLEKKIINRINEIAANLIDESGKPLKRDIIFQHAMKQMLNEGVVLTQGKSKLHFFSFESGTKEALDDLMGANKQFRIEQALLNFELPAASEEVKKLLKNDAKIKQPIGIYLHEEGIDKLKELMNQVANMTQKKITAVKVIREVVKRLIEEISGKEYELIIAEYRLIKAQNELNKIKNKK